MTEPTKEKSSALPGVLNVPVESAKKLTKGMKRLLYRDVLQSLKPRKRSHHFKVGAAPGVYHFDPNAPQTKMEICNYDEERLDRISTDSLEEFNNQVDRDNETWVHVSGLGNEEVLKGVSEKCDLHKLAFEDVLNLIQRPKAESYDNSLFIVLRLPKYDRSFQTQQFSMFLGDGYLLSFQETHDDFFGPIDQRLKVKNSYIRKAKADYLAYALLDIIIDLYFPILEQIGDKIESIEAQVLESKQGDVIERTYALRQELLAVRRSLWPMRELMNSLLRDYNAHFSKETRVYLRDCYDHVVQALDMLESYREITSSLVDLYLTLQGNRMNEIMKILTIIGAIFIPLNFIAALYGMNFDPSVSNYNMPETQWRYGYLFALGLMSILALSLLTLFYYKGWIGNRPDRIETSEK